jgi:endonuclease/exonuclease/phosphatase (EEP) superfamily protein YafD
VSDSTSRSTFEGPRRSRALGRWVPALLPVPWAVWALARTFGVERGDLAVHVMTFTPWAALTSLLPLAVALALRRVWPAIAAGVVVVLLALAVVPRMVPGPRPAVGEGVDVRVMASNLYVGRADARAVVAMVRRERIAVLALEELPPEELAALDRAGLRRLLPYRNADARPGANGSGLFSRFPLTRRDPYNSTDQNGEPRALVAVPGTPPLDVQVVHPPPPSSIATWHRVLGDLPRVDRGDGHAHLLLGDFNASLDHHDLRRLLGGDDGYVDAADATGKGLVATWPTNRRFPPVITIDHVLADPRSRAESFDAYKMAGSDHRAVVVTLRIPRRL